MALTFFENNILGGADDFIQVRHLRLQGSNYDIGQKLAETARRYHKVMKTPQADPRKAKAQRRYIRENYPAHYDRMRGAADALQLDFTDDRFDFSYLNYAPWLPGCSTVFYPPPTTQNGHPILSRNFDFTTGTFMATQPQPGEAPAAAQPYIIECYPDEGFPSLYLCGFDLLGGCLDGVNARGLTVALNADAVSGSKHSMQPTFASSVGISEIQLARMLLDRCADVEEAQQLLLLTKQFYMCAPCHYLIGDRSGRSFVWEYGPSHNAEYIIEGNGQPQILTNHLLCSGASIDELPVEDFSAGTVHRYRTLSELTGQPESKYSLDQIKDNSAQVFITDRSYPQPQPVPDRTIWHALYDSAALSLEISFYLRDQISAEGRVPLRSPYLRFCLDQERK